MDIMLLSALQSGHNSCVGGQPTTGKPYRAYELFPDITPGYASGTEFAWQERKVIKKEVLEARLKKEAAEKAAKEKEEQLEGDNKEPEGLGLRKTKSLDGASVVTEVTAYSMSSIAEPVKGCVRELLPLGTTTLVNETFLNKMIRKVKKVSVANFYLTFPCWRVLTQKCQVTGKVPTNEV